MAVPPYKDLLSARQSQYGLDDPKVAQVFEDLGYAYSKTDKAKKAESSFKSALAIREKHAKQDPAALKECTKRYADFLRGAGRKDDADKLEGKGGAPAAPVAPTTPGKPTAAPAKTGAATTAPAKPGAAKPGAK